MQGNLKWWFYLILAATAFVVAVAIAGSLSVLFWQSIMPFLIVITAYALGIITIVIFPLPVTGAIMQIAEMWSEHQSLMDGVSYIIEILETLVSDRQPAPLQKAQSEPTTDVTSPVSLEDALEEVAEALGTIVTFAPHPPVKADYYLVMIRAKEGPNRYLQSLRFDGTAQFTDDPDAAQKFPRLQLAKNAAWIVYAFCNCTEKLEVCGITQAVAPHPNRR